MTGSAGDEPGATERRLRDELAHRALEIDALRADLEAARRVAAERDTDARDAAWLRDALAQVTAERDALRAELEGLRATRTLRYTERARRVYGRLRRPT